MDLLIKVRDELLLYMNKTNGYVLIKAMLASKTDTQTTWLTSVLKSTNWPQCSKFISYEFITLDKQVTPFSIEFQCRAAVSQEVEQVV